MNRFCLYLETTHVTTIAVGGIVRTLLISSCIGDRREKAVPAGSTFSGRQYELVKIRFDKAKVKPKTAK